MISMSPGTHVSVPADEQVHPSTRRETDFVGLEKRSGDATRPDLPVSLVPGEDTRSSALRKVESGSYSSGWTLKSKYLFLREQYTFKTTVCYFCSVELSKKEDPNQPS